MIPWVREVLQWMMDYRDILLLAILVLLFILMLILSGTVRKNMRLQMEWTGRLEQMIQSDENTLNKDKNTFKDVKTLKKEEKENRVSENSLHTDEEKEDSASAVQSSASYLKQNLQQEEELFGKVLQEYFR